MVETSLSKGCRRRSPSAGGPHRKVAPPATIELVLQLTSKSAVSRRTDATCSRPHGLARLQSGGDRCHEPDHGTVRPYQAPAPPGPRGSPLLQSGEPVLVELRPDVRRHVPREGVALEQPQHGGRALEQPSEEHLEPRGQLVAAQRGKPHLPIEPWLVRLDEARPS